MKIITLWQPWATLIALKLKHYETRSWNTNYRGQLVVHAAKRPVKKEEVAAILESAKLCTPQEIEQLKKALDGDMPLGAIVCAGDLRNCLKMMDGWVGTNSLAHPGCTVIQSKSYLEKAVGNWKPGRFAWRLENIIALTKPIPYKGGQGLRSIDSNWLSLLDKSDRP